VFYLGYTFMIDAVRRPVAQRAWADVCLAMGIMIVCVRYGYLAGVLVGVVCACLVFSISYARIGVVRRAVTRAAFASYVERSPQESQQLRDRGEAIRIYWLSGYIFFGSSESVYGDQLDQVAKLLRSEERHARLLFTLVDDAGRDRTRRRAAQDKPAPRLR
jgi:sulfate permease, SulP family